MGVYGTYVHVRSSWDHVSKGQRNKKYNKYQNVSNTKKYKYIYFFRTAA